MKRLTTLLAAAMLAGATSLAFAQDIKIALDLRTRPARSRPTPSRRRPAS